MAKGVFWLFTAVDHSKLIRWIIFIEVWQYKPSSVTTLISTMVLCEHRLVSRQLSLSHKMLIHLKGGAVRTLVYYPYLTLG